MPDIDYLKIWRDALTAYENCPYSASSGADSTATDALRASFEAATTPEPDPNLVIWTPDDGPLADALANLPDGHPVTICGDWGEIHTTFRLLDSRIPMLKWWMGGRGYDLDPTADRGITSASWNRPIPYWDGALVIAYEDGWIAWRGEDGKYRGNKVNSEPMTAAELAGLYGNVRVLIDKDGHHVGGHHE